MQLLYFIDIFEDNRNVVRDLVVTGSAIVLKNRPLFAKKHKEISICINLAQSHQKNIEIVTRNNNALNFHKPGL